MEFTTGLFYDTNVFPNCHKVVGDKFFSGHGYLGVYKVCKFYGFGRSKLVPTPFIKSPHKRNVLHSAPKAAYKLSVKLCIICTTFEIEQCAQMYTFIQLNQV